MEVVKTFNYEKKSKPTDLLFGKVPPQAKEMESAILGVIMLEKTGFDIANDILKAECFYSEQNQRIYSAMQDLAARNFPIDMMTVVEQLKKADSLELAGGVYAISKLTDGVTSGVSLEYHARIVLQKFLLREAIRISGEVIKMAYDETSDVFEVLDFAEDNVSALRMNNVRKSFKSLQTIIAGNLKALEELRLKDEAITGVPSCFDELDRITCGWQDTDLIIIGARPSVGKTAFALTLAKNAAKNYRDIWKKEGGKQKAVGLFSLEMNDRQLVNRVLSSESDVWLWRLQNGKMDDWQLQKLYSTAEKLNECQILVDDTAALKIQEFKAKARIMVRKHNVGIIFIDYLQLMKDPSKKMREQEISSISSSLKEMAKELMIPIIALSQLSREFGKATGAEKRDPQLSDLRESGAIEQDADMVMFLSKPGDEQLKEDAGLNDIFYLKIAKFRNGTAPVKFLGKFVKETQSHEWLKIVDGNMQLVGEKWTPVTSNDYTQTKQQQQEDLF